MKRVNYLNNRDILAEIHKSKNTFCSYTDDDFAQYDIILPSIDKINIRTIADAKRNQAKRIGLKEYESRKEAGEKVKQADCAVDYRKIAKTDVVFRIMTYDHIPEEKGRKKNPKTVADTKTKLNFPPFQHYKFNDKDELESSMFNYLKIKQDQKSSRLENIIIQNNFVNEDLKVEFKDYYFSNVIARSSKTMLECNNSKLEFKKTGTEG